jgi:uncharacterized protein (TIGR02996 family)
MNERYDLYAVVVDNPFDDAPRLIFADYLEERDQEEFAHFIRTTIKIHSKNLSPDDRYTLGGQVILNRSSWFPDAHNAGQIIFNHKEPPYITRTWPLFNVLRGFPTECNLTLHQFVTQRKDIVATNPICKWTISDRLPQWRESNNWDQEYSDGYEFEFGSDKEIPERPYLPWKWLEYAESYGLNLEQRFDDSRQANLKLEKFLWLYARDGTK